MAGRDGRENLANHRTDRVCAIRRMHAIAPVPGEGFEPPTFGYKI